MAQTILFGSRETTIEGAAGEGDRLWVPLGNLEQASGWKHEPQGLCQGEACVPVPPEAKDRWLDEAKGRFDLAAFAAHLGQSVARDGKRGVWSFGPASRPATGAFAAGSGPVEAPDFTLPDLDGKRHSLSEQRGKKVLLLAWASW